MPDASGVTAPNEPYHLRCEWYLPGLREIILLKQVVVVVRFGVPPLARIAHVVGMRRIPCTMSR